VIPLAVVWGSIKKGFSGAEIIPQKIPKPFMIPIDSCRNKKDTKFQDVYDHAGSSRATI